MKSRIEFEFELPEETEEYKVYMQAADAHSALWKIRETFHSRAKRAETDHDLHEEVDKIICDIIGEYNVDL